MPLGGYCETCGRWVWVNGYGECENGHPAAVVRDVQQLRPQEVGACGARRRPPSGARAAQTTLVVALLAVDPLDVRPRPQLGRLLLHRRARTQCRVDRLGPRLPAGRRRRHRSGRPPATRGSRSPSVALQGVSVLQAFLVRPQFRALMFGDAPVGSLPAPPPLLPQARARRPAQGHRRERRTGHRRRRTSASTSILEAPTASRARGPRPRRAAVRVSREDPRRAAPRAAPDRPRARLPHVLPRGRLPHRHAATPASSTRDVGSADVQAHSPARRDLARRDPAAFDKQLAGLLEHEVIDLDSEVALLEKTVQMDDLMEPAAPAADTDATTGGTT